MSLVVRSTSLVHLSEDFWRKNLPKLPAKAQERVQLYYAIPLPIQLCLNKHQWPICKLRTMILHFVFTCMSLPPPPPPDKLCYENQI